MNTVIDTTNKIFRISCGAEFALKMIGRKKCACVSCACLSMGGSHALFSEFPPPFGDLQAAVIPLFSRHYNHSCQVRLLYTSFFVKLREKIPGLRLRFFGLIKKNMVAC